MNGKFVILVSPHFPPSTLAGVHRARHLAKYLPATGWQPIVLCVDEAFHEEKLDIDLAALVPASTEVVKVSAAPIRLTRLAGVGEITLRAWYPLKHGLFHLLATRPVGALLITGSPYYPMLLASEVKRRFGIPVVLDFQDPWVSNWGNEQPLFSKAGLVHRLSTVLEPRAVRAADFLTSVSEVQNREMAARYPWVCASRMASIPIGGDPEDFVALRAGNCAAGYAVTLDPGFIHLSYVGTYLPQSGPLLRALFRGFARLRAADPALAARIRLNFVGTSSSRDVSTYRVRPIAETEGAAAAVREIPQRFPYLTALSVLARSDGLLLIGSDEPHYTASKIYPALMSGKPFLSLFHRSSSAHAILSACGGGCPLAFETSSELEKLEVTLAEGLRTLALRPASLGTVNRSVFARYDARAVAAQFAAIFDRLAGARTT